MTRNTKSNVFILTLTEMWNADREMRESRRRVQCKARADRFMAAFRPKSGHLQPGHLQPGLHAVARTLQGTLAE